MNDLNKLAAQLRISSLWSIHKTNSGHATSALSCMEILTLLYFGELDGAPILKHNPALPHWDGRDYFVLSKAHAAPALYAVLAERGFFPKEELDHLRKTGGLLQGYPSKKIPGIDASIGSSGHGISIANGIALALKVDRKSNRVYAVIGDGELQNGQIWEACLTSAQHKLDNLTVFVDDNKLQRSNFTRAIKNVEPIGAKFSAFGWNVITVSNGHDFSELADACRKAWKTKLKPTVIICNTIKGKGVAFAENKALYHGVAFSRQEMDAAARELGVSM